MRSRRIRTSVFIVLIAALAGAASAQDAPAPAPTTQPATTSETTAIRESMPLGAQQASKNASDISEEAAPPGGKLEFSRTIAALVGVIGLAFTLALVWKWFAQKRGGLIASLGAGGRAPSGVIEVLARYPIARTQRLVLLRVGRRVVLACQSSSVRGGAGAMSTLSEFTDPDEVAALLRSVREIDQVSSEVEFKKALRELERTPTAEPLSTTVQYRSAAGDTVQLSDPRVQIPKSAGVSQPAPAHAASSQPEDPSIGLLRSRLAAMRSKGDAA